MKRVHIEVDRASLLELARGGNLYADPFACVRELVQNAADATLLRLFEERGEAAFPTHEGSIAELRAALAARPITVRVEPVGGDPRAGAVRFRIWDRGTGLAPADVDYLGTLGASWRNPRRRAAIAAMPEWMRPSGTFGIGIHSVFLVADEVRLRTTHFVSGESLALRLFRDEDGVAIDVDDAEPLEGGGTEVVLDVPRDKVRAGRFAEVREASFAEDPLGDTKLDLALVGARAFARELGGGSVVPVDVDGTVTRAAFDAASTVFDAQTLVELAWVAPPPGERAHPGWRPRSQAELMRVVEQGLYRRVYYRGAPVLPGGRPPLPIDVMCNLHFGTARGVLMLSRDLLSDGGQREVRQRITDAFRRVGPRWLDASSAVAAPAGLRPWVSRALWLDRQPTAGDAWRDADVQELDDGSTLTLGALADQPYVRLHSGRKTRVELPTLGRSAEAGEADDDLERAFGHTRLEEATPEPDADAGDLVTLVHRLDRESEGATLGAAKTLLRHGGFLRWSRALLPRPDGYEALDVDAERLHREWYGEAGHAASQDLRARFPAPYVVADHVLTAPRLTQHVRALAALGRHGPRDPVAVARAVWRFLVDFDDDVRAAPGLTVRYDLDALRAELEAAFAIALPAVSALRAELGLPGRAPTT